MKKIMCLLAVVLITSVGCEQKVENQGNFAKTEEFFKEINPSAAQAKSEVPPQGDQVAQSTAGSTEQPSVTASTTETTPEAAATTEAALPADPTINDIQLALANANLYEGKIDGVLGPKTKKAILAFQAQNNLKVDGKVGPKTWQQLKYYLTMTSQAVSTGVTEAQQTASND